MFNTEYNILFAFATSLIIAYLVIPKLIIFADKYRLSDVAGKRASHKGSVPIFGGVAIFSGLIFSLLFWSDIIKIQFLVTSFVIVFFIGIIDDLLGISPYKKLVGQLIAILIIVYLGGLQIDSMHGVLGIYEMPDIVATLFTAFVVIVITNGFNLIDGIDGLAGGVGVVSSFSFGVVAFFMKQFDMAIISFSLMGALLAFLRYNFYPAKIFMGDTGSLLVGVILSVLAINLIDEGIQIEMFNFPNKGPVLSIVFLALPLFDSLRVFIARIRKGRHPLYPGRGHIHHALLKLGVGHKKTSLLLCVFSILLIPIAFSLLELNINASIAILAGISFIGLLIPFYILKDQQEK